MGGSLWCDSESDAPVTSDTTAQILMDLGPRAHEISDGEHVFKAGLANEHWWSLMSHHVTSQESDPLKQPA